MEVAVGGFERSSWCLWEMISEAERGSPPPRPPPPPPGSPVPVQPEPPPFVLSPGGEEGRVLTRSAPRSLALAACANPAFASFLRASVTPARPVGREPLPAQRPSPACVWLATLRPHLAHFGLFAFAACHRAGPWWASHKLRIWPWAAPPLGGRGPR